MKKGLKNIFYNFFSIYKNGKYYQKYKKRLQKEARERYKNFLEEEKGRERCQNFTEEAKEKKPPVFLTK